MTWTYRENKILRLKFQNISYEKNMIFNSTFCKALTYSYVPQHSKIKLSIPNRKQYYFFRCTFKGRWVSLYEIEVPRGGDLELRDWDRHNYAKLKVILRRSLILLRLLTGGTKEVRGAGWWRAASRDANSSTFNNIKKLFNCAAFN